MIRRFLKDSFLYTFVNLFTRGIGFLLLPIYTRVLSKAEYGLVDYITTIGLIIGVIAALEINQSIYRFIPECKNSLKKEKLIASTSFWFTFMMYSIVIVIACLFSKYLSSSFFGEKGLGPLVILSAILFMLNALLYNITSILRVKLLSREVALLSAINALLVAFLSLLFVLYFELGVYGLIIGQIIAVSLSIIISFKWIKSYLSFIFSIDKLKELLSFSIPLILSSVGVVLYMFVDRVMIKEFLGFDDLAVYAVAIKIASIVTLLTVGFQSALTPLIYTHYTEDETPKKIAFLLKIYLITSLVFLAVISLLADWLVIVVASDLYANAAMYVTPLVLSALLSSVYTFYPGLSLSKKTLLIGLINLFSGLLNVALNYYFILWWGAIGAAYSSIISITIALLLTMYFSQGYYRIPIQKKIIWLFYLLSGVIVFIRFGYLINS